MNNLIAVVDDEEDILELVSLNLKKNGFEARGFGDARGLFRFLKDKLPALIVLDLMLPGMDGLEAFKQLKKDARLSKIPVIMLTAKADESDKLVGLELGADDYVTKPFSVKELIARVKVVLRRGEHGIPVKGASQPKALKIDPEGYSASIDGRKLELTTTEFKILQMLASNPGRVYSRDSILDRLWGDDKIVVDRTIDVHVRHLREKMGKAGNLIKNVRGVGYKLEE